MLLSSHSEKPNCAVIFQGTKGQNKLDGPISQSDAEKNFKKKFQEKTKNAWDERQQFSPVKGSMNLSRRVIRVD